MVAGKIIYFAYGSNMLSRRLRSRVSSASAVCVGFISGHRLTFDKRSMDGSGKCDAEATNLVDDRTDGVLYEIDQAQKGALDAAEGLDRGYAEKTVTVVAGDSEITALMYYATRKDRALKPYNWYKQFVIAGAREHSLPSDYVAEIEWVESIEDLCAKRRAKNELILRG